MVRCRSRSNSRKCTRDNTIHHIHIRHKQLYTTNNRTDKYADDLRTHNNYIDQKDDNIQLAVEGVEKWAIENDMQINTNKTKHMVINQQKQHVSIQPTRNNQTLEQVTNYKYLGAIINEELDSDEQWNSTSKKTNCHIYLIKTLKSMGFKEEILVNIYQSITLSQYC